MTEMPPDQQQGGDLPSFSVPHPPLSTCPDHGSWYPQGQTPAMTMRKPERQEVQMGPPLCQVPLSVLHMQPQVLLHDQKTGDIS